MVVSVSRVISSLLWVQKEKRLRSSLFALTLHCLISRQGLPGEALTKDELQNGVDVANEIADGYTKSTHTKYTHPNKSVNIPDVGEVGVH